MTKIFFPAHLLAWLDNNRGYKSRQSFIVDLLLEVMSSSKYK